MTQVILYADDLVMLTHDHNILQAYLNTLDKFCHATGMRVNVAKSEVVSFFKRRDFTPKWFFDKKPMKISKEFIYLGVLFSADGFKASVKKSIKRRAMKAKSSLFGIIGTCHGLKVYDIEVLNRLMDGAVVPSALYGAEIWGADLVNVLKENMIHQPLEEVQWLFLRIALWVGKATPHAVMLSEAKRRLLVLKAIENSIGFWNRICSLDDTSIMYTTMKENLADIEHGWANNFCRMLQKTCVSSFDTSMVERMAPIDKKGVMNSIMDKLSRMSRSCYENIVNLTCEANGSKVRACPDSTREGFKAFKYFQWFENSTDDTPYISQVNDVGDIRTLAKFRCGMHWLASETMRSDNIGRSSRICGCCNSGEREDEMHIMFCEAYEHVRQSFPVVFDSELYMDLRHAFLNNHNNVDVYMNKFMNYRKDNFTQTLVGFLRRSVKIRLNALSNST